jgi:4-carboxymuconolactone decarboxylase
MIVVATSNANQCQYCVVAHGAILRIRAKDPLLPDFLATDYKRADLDGRRRAMLDYAVKLSTRPQDVEAADADRLRAAGFDDDDIWDIASVVSLFALSNRLAHAHDIRPNPEFHTMGR